MYPVFNGFFDERKKKNNYKSHDEKDSAVGRDGSE
jgi:hypothetical protein